MNLHCNTKKTDTIPLKIRRPVNAFMLYANENRKKTALMFPHESNKEISRRLGSNWKCLDAAEKSKYFELAKLVDAEHKKKYPNYVYNPKEARIRKALRDASRDRSMGSTAMPPLRNSGRRQGWMQNHEEQLMMTPQEVLRSSMDPLCNSANSYGGENVSPFIPIGGYGKDIMSSPSSFHSSSSYLQTIQNPMVQLQQESAGSWSSYGERMVSRTSDNYMLPDMHTYHHVQQPKQQEIKSMTRHSTDALDVQTNKFINNELQRPEENHSGTEAASKSKYLMADEMFDGKGDDVMCRRGIQSAGTFVSTYTENMTTNVGCKPEGVGRSKKKIQIESECTVEDHNTTTRTEEQTRTDVPFFVPFSETNPNYTNRENMRKYFDNFTEYDSHEVTSDSPYGVPFKFVSYTRLKFNEYVENGLFNRMNMEDGCCPNFIETDVGFIPVCIEIDDNQVLDLSNSSQNNKS